MITGKFPSFSEKRTLCAKLLQEWRIDRPTICLVPHSFPHSMFANSTGLFLVFCKFHTCSTNLHTQGHKSSGTEFSRNVPVFQENLHCLQNWEKNDLAGILKCYPLIISQSIKISVLFHKST